MTRENKFQDGKDAVNNMKKILADMWRQNALRPFYNESLELINRRYCKARDAAIAFGEDTNQYPRRLRWRTTGLEITGDRI